MRDRKQKKKWFKRKRVFLPVLSLLLFCFFSIEKVEESNSKGQEYYLKSMSNIDSAFSLNKEQKGRVFAGWGKGNITPLSPKRIVGYGIQDDFETVHDSVFVRSLVFEQKDTRYLMLSYDLLFIHPNLKERLEKQLIVEGMSFDGVYYSATHSHNSFGGWGYDKLIDEIVVAGEDLEVLDYMISQTIQSIKKATSTLSKVEIGYGKYNFQEYIRNRIKWHGPIDPWLHVVKLVRLDKKDSALINTYSAHATCLFTKMDENILSGDYPGNLSLSFENKYGLSMFCAGGIASFSPVYKHSSIEGLMDYSGRLFESLQDSISMIKNVSISSTRFVETEILLPTPTFRISENYRLRPYLFNALMGEIKAHMKYFQLGNISFLGMPGEISGEIYQEEILKAKAKNRNLIVTSLNGDYIGYIVPKKYYHTETCREVREMNWFGPVSGDYFDGIINKVVNRLDQ